MMRHNLSNFLKLCTALFFMTAIDACKQKDKPLSPGHEKAHAEFCEKLAKGRDHYLKLVGLHPIAQGANSFGSSKDNTIQLNSENVPATIGVIEHGGDRMAFTASDGLEIRTLEGDSLVHTWSYGFETATDPPMLKHNHLEWQVIKRGRGYFLRVKDQDSPLAKEFKGFESYPLRAKYVVQADYQLFGESRTESINTHLGTAEEMDFVGVLSFEWGEKEYKLSVGEGGFLMVGDRTNGSTTYGGGRYVYVDLPEKSGKVTIDFNRLYNPPCAYSKFTTCPLPPVQNILPVEVVAGEKHARL